MKVGGMICYYPGTIWLDFGIDRVKGHSQGHEKVKIFFSPKVKIFFSPIHIQLACN